MSMYTAQHYKHEKFKKIVQSYLWLCKNGGYLRTALVQSYTVPIHSTWTNLIAPLDQLKPQMTICYIRWPPAQNKIPQRALYTARVTCSLQSWVVDFDIATTFLLLLISDLEVPSHFSEI